jgi:predicted nucleic acid binding AN1-type Zn finger protein
MIEIISFPKDNVESVIYNITNVNNIFDIKKLLSEKIQSPIEKIFIFDFENPTKYYENYVKITTEKYYYKILTNKCACCLRKSTIITGDCKYCSCNYCNIHRLPESHCCIGLDKCKTDSFQENYTKTIGGKCVKSQIEVL